MTAGRTVLKYAVAYVDGYDLTGYTRTFGPLTQAFEEADSTTLGDAVKNAMPGQVNINPGTLDTVLDNTTGATHSLIQSSAERTLMYAIGGRAAPAQGDPAFVGTFLQSEFMTTPASGSAVTLSGKFGGWGATAATLLYNKPWGWLLHAKGAETAVNTAIGIDDTIAGAATAAGGYMCYQLFSSNGTVTLKVQHAATNTNVSFSDLVSSSAITAAVTPTAGLVALSNTASVSRYIRWQLTFGTATTATFAIAFVRG